MNIFSFDVQNSILEMYDLSLYNNYHFILLKIHRYKNKLLILLNLNK